MTDIWVARKCPCGHKACQDWHVVPVAAVQGVKFTETEAKALVQLNSAYGGIEYALAILEDLMHRPKEMSTFGTTTGRITSQPEIQNIKPRR